MLGSDADIINYVFPKKLSAKRLDTYLAAGWFRSEQILFRSKLLVFNEQITTPINIRFSLENHVWSKKNRKILRDNNQNFTHTVRSSFISEEKQILYENHRHRFTGYFCKNLSKHLNLSQISIFNTYEVCVYDNNKLIAVSFFDLGEKSAASLLGIFDDNYKKHSLGIYTMLLEIEFCKQRNIEKYYPGYVLDQPSSLDYKMRMGDFEMYDFAKKKWQTPDSYFPVTIATEVRAKMDEVERVLRKNHVGFIKKIYPFFAAHYNVFNPQHESFYHSPFGFIVGQLYENEIIVVGYQPVKKEFTLSVVSTGYYLESHDHEFIHSPTLSSNIYPDVAILNWIIQESPEIEDFVSTLVNNTMKMMKIKAS
jgi:leucyl-tRNA---protein transferase